MTVTVLTVVAPSPPQSSNQPNSASPEGDADQGGFASLLAGQMGSADELASTAPIVEEPALDKLQASLTDLSSDPLASIVSLDTLPLRDMAGNFGGERSADLKSANGRIDFALGRGKSNAASQLAQTMAQNSAGVAALRAATDSTLATSEPANLAGESLSSPTTGFNAALVAQERAATQARPPVQASVSTPLSDPRWTQSFGERVVWLARSDIQSAQININPAQLGPIQININMNGDQMNAAFVSAHAEVRQLLEEALPRLREMLSGSGINLGQANVGAQLPQQQRDPAQQQFAGSSRFRDEAAILSSEPHATASMPPGQVHRGRGLVDLFA